MSAGIVRGWSGRLGGLSLSGLEIFDEGPWLTFWGEKQPCFKCWEGEDFCWSCSCPAREKLGGQLVEVLRGVLFSCWQSRCIFPGFEVLEDLLREGRPSICVWKLLPHVNQNLYFLNSFWGPRGRGHPIKCFLTWSSIHTNTGCFFYCSAPKMTQYKKHRKNCEYCPGHYLIVNHYSSS